MFWVYILGGLVLGGILGFVLALAGPWFVLAMLATIGIVWLASCEINDWLHGDA